MPDAQMTPPTGASAAAPKTWHCGTLTYTKMGLVSLFGFMIWGDFANVMIVTVVPSIMPLKFKELGASNVVIGLLASSIPSILAAFMVPYISFKSDRHRSRWGRRRPFILFTLPPLCLSLVALAYGEEIAKVIFPYVDQFAQHSPATVAIACLGVLLVVFLFFEQFVNAVFCGLFNDVVPTPLMGRFMGTMRIVGSAAGFLYSYFLFQFAESHMREIFLGVAALYFFGVGMMCLFVKEGEYPQPTESEKQSSRGVQGFLSYFRESFCHPFYWLKFGYTACAYLSYAGVGAFMVFFYKDMGLTLGDVGKVTAIIALAGMATAYFGSIFIDRWHPIRIIAYSAILGIVFVISNFVWLYLTISPLAFLWLHMMGAGLIGAFSNSVTYVASLPFDMRLHPKSRFTQFCSAQALVRHLCTIFAGVFVGVFFDSLKRVFPDSDYAYRFWFVWVLVLSAGSIFFIYKLYRMWHVLGGDASFQAPAPWSSTGSESQEQSAFVGPQTRWIHVNFWVIRAVLILSVIYLIPTSYHLWILGWHLDFDWHVFGFIPLSILLYVFWLRVERSIKRDMELCRSGESPRWGIPHHGVLLFKSSALLLLFGIWIGKTVVAFHDGLETGILILGWGNLLTNLAFIAAVVLLRYMERGHPQMLDFDGRKSGQEMPVTVA